MIYIVKRCQNKRTFIFLFLLCITPQDVKSIGVAVQLAWWVIKSEFVKQSCKVATILVIKNSVDMSDGVHPSMAISQQAMDALKKAGYGKSI